MNIDPDVVGMIAKLVAVNAAAVLLLAVLSYATSALLLEGLAALDKWLDPSRKPAVGALDSGNVPNQSPDPIPPRRDGSL